MRATEFSIWRAAALVGQLQNCRGQQGSRKGVSGDGVGWGRGDREREEIGEKNILIKFSVSIRV